MSVDVTPPENPATRCSYRTVENMVGFRLAELLLIAAIVLPNTLYLSRLHFRSTNFLFIYLQQYFVHTILLVLV